MNIIDTHSHIFTEDFHADLPDVIARAQEVGVSQILMPNIDLDSIDAMLNVCQTYPDTCFPMIGLHPTSVDADYRKTLATLKLHLSPAHPYIGIGEAGLDLYWDTTYRLEQMHAFDEQIQWALACDLPLVIHCRKAFTELTDCLSPYRHTPLRGVFHSFTGDDCQVDKLLAFDRFLLGINGVVTFKKAKLPAILKSGVPLNRLVVETDSPYLTPVPHRGKRNESAFISAVVGKLSDLYELSPDDIAQQTTDNARRLFGKVIR